MYYQQQQEDENVESRISYNTQKEQLRAKGKLTRKGNQGKTLRLNPPKVTQRAKVAARQQKIKQQATQEKQTPRKNSTPKAQANKNTSPEKENR